MKNRNTKMFRFKVKKPRQTAIHMYSDTSLSKQDAEQPDSSSLNSRFSSQYLSMTKKFNIKMINTSLNNTKNLNNLKNPKNNEANRDFSNCSVKGRQLRVKTQFSREKTRYQWESTPMNVQLGRMKMMQGIWSNQGSNMSARSNKIVGFNVNRNTVYNDSFIKNKGQIKDPSLFLPQQQPPKLSIQKSDKILIFLGNHTKKLLPIYHLLSSPQTLSQLQLLRHLKQYILKQQNHSIGKLHKYFKKQIEQRQIKLLIAMERIVLVALVAGIVGKGVVGEIREEGGRAVEIVLGFWERVIGNTYRDNIFKLEIQHQSAIKDTIEELSQAKLLTKNNLSLLLQTLQQKLPLLFKHSRSLYTSLFPILIQSKQTTINRTFYQILTILATYLTNFQAKHGINLDHVSFFATCPSPYLVEKGLKKYTLVLDLDQTLIYSTNGLGSKNNSGSKRSPGKINGFNITERIQGQVMYRPYCFQFLKSLSSTFQIIIFTTSLQSYAIPIISPFKSYISHILFRQHAVHAKNGLVKDLSRIGRDLSKLIIIDDSPGNFRFQKDNAIWIGGWRGEEGDRELEELEKVLGKIGQGNGDVREEIKKYKDEIVQKNRNGDNNANKTK